MKLHYWFPCLRHFAQCVPVFDRLFGPAPPIVPPTENCI